MAEKGRGKAKIADRARAVSTAQALLCQSCGQPTRIVKRIKNRAMGISGGMYYSCTACGHAHKK